MNPQEYFYIGVIFGIFFTIGIIALFSRGSKRVKEIKFERKSKR